MAIEWQSSLAIGVEEIDHQHKELFERVNLLLEACSQGRGREEVHRLLRFLNDYVRTHFAAEERLQQKVAYPEFVSHLQQHKEFSSRLGQLERELAQDGATLSVIIQTNQTMISWLLKHINGMDKEFGEFYRRSTTTSGFSPR